MQKGTCTARDRTLLCLFVMTCCLLSPAVRADVTLPSLFSDNMMLQRDAVVQVWGWADSGEVVTVDFRGQSVQTVATNGSWRLTLAATPAGGPFTMQVQGDNTIHVQNILVGDVWVSCGQSNMMMSLSSADGGAAAAAGSTNYPTLRLFSVSGDPRATSIPDDIAGTWKVISATAAQAFSAVSFYFGRALNRDLGVPIGLVNVVAIVPAEAWVDADTLHADPELDALFSHALNVASKSYMGLIAPIQPYSIRGAIYYQGEYNAGRGKQFQTLFPALIRSWRMTWGQGDFPFLFVQLPGYHEGRAPDDPILDMPDPPPGTPSAWAELREAQLMTWQTVTNTGMAITIDVGEAWDIHPIYKEPVGERLALQARHAAYGEMLVHSGPVLDTVTRRGSNLVLRFTHTGGGLAPVDRPLDGFHVAGEDQVYTTAQATVRGDTVLLSCPGRTNLVHVRYAWANYPWAFYPVDEPPVYPSNALFNAEGLPATPFRATVSDTVYAAAAFTIPFRNPSFEVEDGASSNARDWIESGGAVRSSDTAADGAWCMKFPQGGKITQDGMVPGSIYRYDWNSDLFDLARFRPGTVTGYAVDMASGDGSERKLYMNLCCNSTAGGYQYWGGIPNLYTDSPAFVRRNMAYAMKSLPSMPGDSRGIGGRYIDQSATAGWVYLDNFSDLRVVRPKLGVSDVTPISFGTVAPGTTAVSEPRAIFNAQTNTLPRNLTDGAATNQVASILYGICNVTNHMSWGYVHTFEHTDHVGARIIGPHSNLFEFVTTHPGETARELRLVGDNGADGLTGGLPPVEQETLAVRFLGSAVEGPCTATVRIVTQAGNAGRLSAGGDGEPLVNLYFTDIPLIAHVMVDLDDDDMSDASERYYFGGRDVVRGGAHDDWDEDGAVNIDELRAGTNPTNAASRFCVSSFEHVRGARWVLAWQSASNRVYEVMTASSLLDPGRISACHGVPATPPLNRCEIIEEPTGSHFYCVGLVE